LINIEIKDHNSKIIGLIPSHLHEPIAFIAKMSGFENVDDYVIDVLKRELESIRKGEGHGAAKFGECIVDYLQKIIPSPPALTAHSFGQSIEKEEDSVSVKEEEDEHEDEWKEEKK